MPCWFRLLFLTVDDGVSGLSLARGHAQRCRMQMLMDALFLLLSGDTIFTLDAMYWLENTGGNIGQSGQILEDAGGLQSHGHVR